MCPVHYPMFYQVEKLGEVRFLCKYVNRKGVYELDKIMCLDESWKTWAPRHMKKGLTGEVIEWQV